MVEDYSELLDKENVTEVAVETAEEAEQVEAEVEAEAEEAKTEEVETEETTEETAEQTTGSEKEPWTLTAVLDEREKRQKRDVEIAELKEKLSAYEKPESDEVSVFEDEQGYTNQQDQKIQFAVRNATLNSSQRAAEREFGKERVAEAAEWWKTSGNQSPTANQRFQESDEPYHDLIKMHEDDSIIRNPQSYKDKIRAEVRAELESEKAPEPNTPSLASSRSVGEKTISDDNFEDILNE